MARRPGVHECPEGSGDDVYGGLLLYDTPLGSDPATVFAPAGAGVVGTAMAGQVNATKNTVRGSANLTETKMTRGAVS